MNCLAFCKTNNSFELNQLAEKQALFFGSSSEQKSLKGLKTGRGKFRTLSNIKIGLYENRYIFEESCILGV